MVDIDCASCEATRQVARQCQTRTLRLTNPDLGLGQSVPLRCEEKLDALPGSLQGQCFNTENREDHVGEDSTEPEDLKHRQELMTILRTPQSLISK